MINGGHPHHNPSAKGMAAELLRERKISHVDVLRRDIMRRIDEGPISGALPLIVKPPDQTWRVQ